MSAPMAFRTERAQNSERKETMSQGQAPRPLFPNGVSPAEQTAGFALGPVVNSQGHYASAPPTIQAVRRNCNNGLWAVKMQHPGKTNPEYAIWGTNAQGIPDGRPRDLSALTLTELLQRYP